MHDVLIIGGGPAGLTAGVYCRMRRLSALIVDADRAGGQPRSTYPEKRVRDWPGQHEVVAHELADLLVRHARELEVEFAEHEKVVAVRRITGRFEAVTRTVPSGDERIRPAGAVIIAIGAGAFEPRRLRVPGEDALGPDSVTYRMPDPARVAGRRVVVVGGGDSGLESAQAARRAATSVTIVHSRAAWKGMEANLEAVERLGITRLLDTSVLELVVRDGALEAVIVQTRGASGPVRIDCDYLVVNVGAAADLGVVQNLGVEVVQGRIQVDAQMRTSVPGLFACGDIAAFEGKYKLLITASSEGAVAANSAFAHVRRPSVVTMKDLYT